MYTLRKGCHPCPINDGELTAPLEISLVVWGWIFQGEPLLCQHFSFFLSYEISNGSRTILIFRSAIIDVLCQVSDRLC